MTFPSDHRWPGELPAVELQNHSFRDVGVAEDIAFEQGEDRSRQIWSFNAQIVTIRTDLSQRRFDRFCEWYENDLRGGTSRFDVQVAEQGGVLRSWWEGQFIGQYRFEVGAIRHYLVTAELLLLDGPYPTRTAPGLRATTPLRFDTSAAAYVDGVMRASTPLGFDTTVRLVAPSLLAHTPLAFDTSVIVDETTAGRITEAGEQRITEGGDARATE